MLATIVGRWEKILKKHWLKRLLAVSQKTKFEPNYKWFNTSYLEFFFWKCYFVYTTFFRTVQWTSSEFFLDFRFSSRKSQRQQKLAKEIILFQYGLTQNTSLILWTSTHLILKIICSRNTIKNFSHFTNFPENIFLFGVRKKNLQWTISWHPITAFFKHFESNVCIFM